MPHHKYDWRNRSSVREIETIRDATNYRDNANSKCGLHFESHRIVNVGGAIIIIFSLQVEQFLT